jgi:hypothetical protein
MNLWRPLIVAIALLLGAALEIAWQAGPAPAAEDVPSMANQEPSPRLADRLFRVEWTAGASSQGQTRIIGYVYNESEHDAANVELRISDLDASGHTVRSVIKPIGDPIPAAGRVFFDLEVAGTSPSYQIAVESFGLMDDPWTTQGTEQLLAAAGFEMKLADTPEKLANLNTLTPRRTLIPQERDNRLYYAYADPDLCKCLYVGTSTQYERARQQSYENDQSIAVGQQLNALVWDLWAPWPWF